MNSVKALSVLGESLDTPELLKQKQSTPAEFPKEIVWRNRNLKANVLSASGRN